MEHDVVRLANIADEVAPHISTKAAALMLFGSAARGDASPTSDVDVLELLPSPAAVRRLGRVHIYGYSRNQLRHLAVSGSLFVLHLKREGVIIADPLGDLARCLDAYVTPADYLGHRRALVATANLLCTSREDYGRNWRIYNDIAIFALRTALYIRSAETGSPTFSLTRLAQSEKHTHLASALTLKTSPREDFEAYSAAVANIERAMDVQLSNSFGTIEALIVNHGLEFPSLLAFGLRLVGAPCESFGYDVISPVP